MTQLTQPPSPTMAQARPRTGASSSVVATISQWFATFNLKKAIWLGIGAIVIYWASQFLFTTSTLTVYGQGEYSFAADQVSMVVTFANGSQDPKEAIATGKAGVEKLVSQVKALDDQAEIVQSFYQVNPGTSIDKKVVYQVVNAFSVKSSQVDSVDQLVNVLYANGATTVTDISFGSTDEEKMSQQARISAIKDGQQQAQAIARAAGKRLGKLVSIGDDQKKPTSTVGSGNEAGSFKNITVTKTVSLVYKVW